MSNVGKISELSVELCLKCVLLIYVCLTINNAYMLHFSCITMHITCMCGFISVFFFFLLVVS